MDNLAIEALVNELRSTLLGLSCVQVAQVNATAVSLELAGRPPGRLLFAVTDPPLFFLTRKTWSSDVPSSFVAVLRKWLIGTALAGIQKKLDERVVHFEFRGSRPDARAAGFELVAECMPRWGNLYLLDDAHRVLGALLIPRAERRKLTVGSRYTPPGRHGECSLEDFISTEDLLLTLPADPDDLTKHVRGLGPVYAREVLHRAHSSHKTPPQVLSGVLRAIARGELQPRIYELADEAQGFFVSPIELESLKHRPATVFDSTNRAVESLFERHIETILLEKERKELRKDAQATLRKFTRLEEKLEKDATGFLKEAELQRLADLILAQSGELHSQGGRLELVDVYESTPRKITIVVDPRLSPAANAQRFHEKAKRARRGIEKIKARQHSIHRLVKVLESSLDQVSEARDLAELKRISSSWRQEASNPRDTTEKANSPCPGTDAPARPPGRKRMKCRLFKSKNDYEILVGRNSKENDLVTTRYAQPDDYWFHVADYAGSHVVLRNPNRENLEETEDFLEAAQLAAYFSQTRNARKALVHWTQKKFVKKPRRAKPGLVNLSRFQSLLVEPKLPEPDKPPEE